MCEVCGRRATCCCSGLDVPAVYFCDAHGREHAAGCPDVKSGAARLERFEENAPKVSR